MEVQQIVLGIIAAVALIVGAAIGAPRVLRDERWSITRDLEIFKALPPESTAREALLRKIDREVKALDVYDQKRRNPAGIALGIIFTLAGLAGGWFIYGAGGWWWLASPVAASALLVGLVGFSISVGKTIRDEKGSTVSQKPSAGQSET